MPFQGAAHNLNCYKAAIMLYASEDIPPSIPKPVATIQVERTADTPVPEITEQQKPR